MAETLDDAVGVDLERNIDLRHAAWCRRNADEFEFCEAAVGTRDLAFALQNVDLDRLLVIDDGRKRHRILERNGRVARISLTNKPPRVSSPRLKRQNVEQNDVLDVAGQNAALNRGSHRDDLVRIDLDGRLFAKNFGNGSGDDRRTRLAADEDDFVDIRRLQFGVPQCFLAWFDRRFDQIADKFFEFVASQSRVDMFRAGRVGGDERQADGRFGNARKFAFCTFGGFFETLKSETVAFEGRCRFRS